eukprot:CAMPEP_0183721346 /NCGR_PEP_ID=MMETSP0737-20130205/13652_1 /TAXON_ID=385413 /ORGANISM="Thalassiosira miniscula, Strain CCMP1093" /LENGTH=251 /DNA_ID=CAMNT_0025951339 /DNA_START=196 /DNA_END=948 /DNA_ORIENTATION=+
MTDNNNNNEHEKSEKTYIWIKLHSGKFSPNETLLQSKSSNVTNKKRGAPDAGSDDSLWNWAPGYYTGGEEKKKEEGGDAKESDGNENANANVNYQLTILSLSGDGLDSETHELPAASASKLFEAGEIVLANPWEGLDFVTRCSLGGVGNDADDDESEYDYDDDSDDSDSDNDAAGKGGSGKGVTNFLEQQPDDAPPSNLIELTHLHEPSVVHALRHRYEQADSNEDMSSIYTDTGPILLAVNPFQRDETGR